MSVTRIEDSVLVTRTDAADAAIYGPLPVPQPQPLVLPDISDRQCFQQAAIQGLVTQDEALQAVQTGAMPQAVTNGIASLPAAQQFGAKMIICGATIFHRAHPMTPTFMGFLGVTSSSAIDTFWNAAALL